MSLSSVDKDPPPTTIRTQQCHHAKSSPQEFHSHGEATLRPWPWRPEFFQNHSRPGDQRRPLLPLSSASSLLASPLTCLHPAVHQLPPYSPFWSLSKYCGAPGPLQRICAHGVWGIQGRPGGRPQTWLHPHLGPGGPSDTNPCIRHIQTTQGCAPSPGGSTSAVISEN